MAKQTALIGIDLQIDFMNLPGSALPVPGAVRDTERLSTWIGKRDPSVIITSMDTHYELDISHPAWWRKADGSFIDPFTLVSSADIESGKYYAVVDPKRSLEYVKSLEQNGEFMHCIWIPHCIKGTAGQGLLPVYQNALSDWENKHKKWTSFIDKGINPFTEHFGIFRANVPLPGDPNTSVNQGIFKLLNEMDEIILAGQARSHCVVNSLRQLLQIAPNLADKVVVLEDCMSDVQGLPTDFYVSMNAIWNDAKAKGVQFAKSTDL